MRCARGPRRTRRPCRRGPVRRTVDEYRAGAEGGRRSDGTPGSDHRDGSPRAGRSGRRGLLGPARRGPHGDAPDHLLRPVPVPLPGGGRGRPRSGGARADVRGDRAAGPGRPVRRGDGTAGGGGQRSRPGRARPLPDRRERGHRLRRGHRSGGRVPGARRRRPARARRPPGCPPPAVRPVRARRARHRGGLDGGRPGAGDGGRHRLHGGDRRGRTRRGGDPRRHRRRHGRGRRGRADHPADAGGVRRDPGHDDAERRGGDRLAPLRPVPQGLRPR